MEKKRVMYLDHIKVLLTLLVIAHHTCQAYIIGGDWLVKDALQSRWLSNFLCVNMTFFMGAFFFISGYFVPRSLEHKTSGAFIKGRAKRLLLPVLGLVIFIVPSYYYIGACHNVGSMKSFISFYVKEYWGGGMLDYDHGWFLVSLFLYCVFYLVIRKQCQKLKGQLSIKKVVGFTLLMTILTALIRIFYQIDEWVGILGVIGIEPAHLPQYLLWFVAGTLAYENGWLDQISKGLGRGCTVIGGVLAGMIYIRGLIPVPMRDGINAVFPLYESMMSVTIIIALIYLFKTYCNKPLPLLTKMAPNAFRVYIIHNFFVISSQVLVASLNINVYLKFILATLLAITASFVFIGFFSSLEKLLCQRKGQAIAS